MTPIWKSRQFWTAIVDAVVSLILFFVGQYYPASLEAVKFVIAALQPVVAILIIAFTVEGVALIKAESAQYQADVNWEEGFDMGVARGEEKAKAKFTDTPDPGENDPQP
jgi:hypothetical protein